MNIEDVRNFINTNKKRLDENKTRLQEAKGNMVELEKRIKALEQEIKETEILMGFAEALNEARAKVSA